MKTLKETYIKDTTLRLVEKSGTYFGLAITPNGIGTRIQGVSADQVWRQLQDNLAASSPNFFGFEGAKNRFLRIFPKGFESARYAEKERDYKLKAKRLLDEAVPVEAALSGAGYGEQVLTVFRATNLLHPFESMRVQEALRGNRADTFIRGAAKFAFGDIESGLREMEKALQPYEAAKWTTITYLPFLWKPDLHMYLKPNVTCEFAERVGHGFALDYAPQLTPNAYRALLELVDTTTDKISELGPSDNIDIQSFIWVVGSYDEEAEKGMDV